MLTGPKIATISAFEPDGLFAVPDQFNFASDVLYHITERIPSATATIAVDTSGRVEHWTFARVAEAAQRLAAWLAAEGLVAGDRVLLLMPRTPQWQVAMLACLHLGVIAVPCVTQVSAAEVDYRIVRSGAVGAITDRRYLDKLAGSRDRLRVRLASDGGGDWHDLDAAMRSSAPVPPAAVMAAEAPALMYFTSGSSGPPKPVLHAARGLYVRSRQPWVQLGIADGDVIWTTSDTGWTRAASCLLFGAWMNGAAAVMHDGAPDSLTKLAALERFGVTCFGAVATELRLIMAQTAPRPLPALRFTLSAGEAMTAELAHGWRRFSGAPLIVGYGQTETPTATLTAPDAEPLNGMIGRPMEGNRVTVLDEDGNEAAAGIPGQIAFHATDAGLMLGYWDDGTCTLPIRYGEWYLTGDTGWRDADGNIFFVGRDDDIVSSGGYRIGPTEVENALMAHPAVAECAVAASPDALRGEVVKAFVVLRPGHAPSDALATALQEHVKQAIAPYKYPRRIDCVGDLPRTASGKLSRRLLRESEFKSGSVPSSKGALP
jgi:acyl-coenzyme A synthetase/AMP-(fatty) acid ligase